MSAIFSERRPGLRPPPERSGTSRNRHTRRRSCPATERGGGSGRWSPSTEIMRGITPEDELGVQSSALQGACGTQFICQKLKWMTIRSKWLGSLRAMICSVQGPEAEGAPVRTLTLHIYWNGAEVNGCECRGFEWRTPSEARVKEKGQKCAKEAGYRGLPLCKVRPTPRSRWSDFKEETT